MKTFFNIEIPKRQLQCGKGHENLVPGDEVYSAVTEENGDFIRTDYCASCWEALQSSPEIARSITTWKSIVPEKKDQKEIFLNRDQKALALLKEMAESQDTETRHKAFILALYLARRRQLYQRKEISSDEGKPLVLFEVSGTQEMLAVSSFQFSEMDLEAIQKAIAKALKN